MLRTNLIQVTIMMMFTTITAEVDIIIPKNLTMTMTDMRPPATSNVNGSKGAQA
jgi:hypothetical protein